MHPPPGRYVPQVRLSNMFAIALLLAIAPTLLGGAAPEAEDEAQPLFIVGDDALYESSGLALSRQHRLIWTHNDAGNSPVVFGVRPTGETVTRIFVEGVEAEDWEDIAVAHVDGDDWIYLNDVGDAYQDRKARGLTYRQTFEIVRIPEPDVLPARVDMRLPGERFPVRFADGEGVNVESMAVLDSGAILLIEKLETDERPARVWRIPRPSTEGFNVPVPVAEIPVVGASGADASVDGDALVIRDATTARLYDLGRGMSDAFESPRRALALPAQERGEGVAFTLDADGLLLSSEGRDQSIWFVPLGAGATATFGPPMRAHAPEQSDLTAREARERGAFEWLTGRTTQVLGTVSTLLLVTALTALLLRRHGGRGRPIRDRGAGPNASVRPN